ncbi:MAG: hypothetical protein ACQSGP_28175, partial [Frankia sp.]
MAETVVWDREPRYRRDGKGESAGAAFAGPGVTRIQVAAGAGPDTRADRTDQRVSEDLFSCPADACARRSTSTPGATTARRLAGGGIAPTVRTIGAGP